MAGGSNPWASGGGGGWAGGGSNPWGSGISSGFGAGAPALTPQQQLAFLKQLQKAKLGAKPSSGHHWYDTFKPPAVIGRTVDDLAGMAQGMAGVVGLGLAGWQNVLTGHNPDAGGVGKTIDQTINMASDSFYKQPFPELQHPWQHPGLALLDALSVAAPILRYGDAARMTAKNLRLRSPGVDGADQGVKDLVPPRLIDQTGPSTSPHAWDPTQGQLFGGDQGQATIATHNFYVQRRNALAPAAPVAPRELPPATATERYTKTFQSAPSHQGTFNEDRVAQAIPGLISDGQWKIPDWVQATGLDPATAIQVRDAVAQKMGSPVHPKPNPYQEWVNRRFAEQDLPPRPEYVGPLGVEVHSPRRMEPAIVTPETLQAPKVELNPLLPHQTGPVPKGYEPPPLPRDTSGVPGQLTTPGFIDEQMAKEQFAKLDAAAEQMRPRGPSPLKAMEYPPGTVPKAVEPAFAPRLSQAEQDAKMRASLKIQTAEPQRYVLKTNEQALRYRVSAENEIKDLSKQLYGLHGKMNSLERQGLRDEMMPVSRQIEKLEARQTVLKTRIRSLQPHIVHDVVEGVRVKPGGAYARPESALKKIAELNREHGPLVEKIAPEASAQPRGAAVEQARGVAAPRAPRVISDGVSSKVVDGETIVHASAGSPLGGEYIGKKPEGMLTKDIVERDGKLIGRYYDKQMQVHEVPLEDPRATPPKTAKEAGDRLALANDELIQARTPIDASKISAKKTLREITPESTPAEIHRVLSWARKNPEFEHHIPDLEKALAEAKAKAETGGSTRGKGDVTLEKMNPRALTLSPRDIAKDLEITVKDATPISRTVHPAVVKWAKEGGSKTALRALLKPHFGAKTGAVMKRILPLLGAASAGFVAAGPKGLGAAAITPLSPEHVAAAADAIRTFKRAEHILRTTPRTMQINYAFRMQNGSPVDIRPLKTVLEEHGRGGEDAGHVSSGTRALLESKGIRVGTVTSPMSRNYMAQQWMNNVAVPLLEKYPDSKVAGALMGRKSFEAKVRFDLHEGGRIAQAAMSLGLLPKPPQPGESAIEFNKRVVHWMDSANMLAKIAVLFLKPAYIPANLIGQFFLAGVDHAWSPLSLAKSVGIQRELFTKPIRRQLNETEPLRQQVLRLEQNPQRTRMDMLNADELRRKHDAMQGDLAFTRAQKIRALMGGGMIATFAHEASGFGGRVMRAYEWAANGTGKILDTPFRDNAFIHEATRQGYDSAEKIGELLDKLSPIKEGETLHDYVERIQQENPELVDIAMRANRNMIDYGRLSRQERTWIRRVVFFYPWVKGATIYGGRMALEHPFQMQVGMRYGNIQRDVNRKLLGPVPSYGAGYVKVGEQNVPGLGMMPTVVNPASAAVLSTPAEVLSTAKHLFTTEAGDSPTDLLAPLVTLPLGMAMRRDIQSGAEYAANVPRPEILSKEAQKLIAPLNLLRKIRQGDQIAAGTKDASKILLPETPGQAIGRYTIGPSPMSLNTKEAASRAFAENTSTLGRRQQIAARYKQHREQFLKEFKRVGMVEKDAKSLPQPLVQAMQQRAQRDAELSVSQTAAGHTLSPLERLQVEMGLLVRRGVMTQTDAKQILAQLANGTQSQVAYQRRLLNTSYFGGQTISAYSAAARQAGAQLDELR